MSRIMVTLSDVICYNTEDIHGADDFYLTGAVVASFGSEKRRTPVVTKPIKINNGQTIQFRESNNNCIFDEQIPDNWYIKFPLAAYDEDAGKDWSRIQKVHSEIITAVDTGLQFTGPILPLIAQRVKGIWGGDQDDLLGNHNENWYPIRSFNTGWNAMNWDMSGGSDYYSNWSYRVRFWVGKW